FSFKMSLPTLKKYHKKSYAAIDPSSPSLRTTGKTVVVTGGNSGIGYAIARGFTSAGAARVIILGRRPDVVNEAAAKLQRENDELKWQSHVEGRVCDIADLDSTEALWSSLQSDGIFVDILVLNAAAYGAIEPILTGGLSKVWGDFESNVRSTLDMTERFYKQKLDTKAKVLITTQSHLDDADHNSTQFLVNISTVAGTLLLQQIAKDTDPTDMQVVSFHPGGILTESSKALGGDAIKDLVFDDENLPGHFAVWAATPEARFLHGRFVWANWDVEELRDGPVREQIDQDEHFLKVGVEGLSEKMGGMIMS
ncbi:unnamed protein product, partial [Fusarium graminearum]